MAFAVTPGGLTPRRGRIGRPNRRDASLLAKPRVRPWTRPKRTSRAQPGRSLVNARPRRRALRSTRGSDPGGVAEVAGQPETSGLESRRERLQHRESEADPRLG